MLTQPLERLRLIAREAPGCVRPIERRAQARVAEHLRGERAPQTGPLQRLRNPGARALAALSALQSVRRWDRKQPSNRVRAELPEEALEVLRIEARPSRIMHQHPVIGAGAPLEPRQREAHRLAALRTPANRSNGARAPGVQARGHLLPAGILARQRHDDVHTARCIGEKRRERPLDHGASCEGRVLLRSVRAEAAA